MEDILQSENQIQNLIFMVLVVMVLMAVAIVAFFYFSRKKIVKTELEKANMQIEHQKEVIQSTLITQEAERKRIAQDLHDAISSKLNIVSLNANFLTEGDISMDDVHKFGTSILKVTTTVLESSRQIAHDLLPPTLEKFGLAEALDELCDEAGESGAFKVERSLNYNEKDLSEVQELHLFRIVQELFSNSIKYAIPTIITLNVESKENTVSLLYSDNGKGFDLSEAKKAKGLGLSGMENRAVILNGVLSIKSSPGNGIEVMVNVTK
ncbi:sensor histidine kinase [Ulvibacter antarcticus]|uniref:histidine kinase n=1 Tax=Ulvibacter antarcticus TaxID=442714 RepID=A0A3L9YDR9_9FLAO|nr:ATP-binding protein [Ulvibacter antarcticus]RMA58846.1 histidine kinase/DNA gyrase B/HSP90-like ATPase [Ulvibacter antarcticus]